ncbi:MAG: lon ATP-dependent protease [Pseudomonadota bacterium]|jgi:ATP-dependent Lon protease
MNQAVVYPTMMAPLHVTHPRYMEMVEVALSKHPSRTLALLLTRDSEVSEKTKVQDLHSVGVIVKVLKRLKMPDGSISLLVHSLKRFRVKAVLSEEPFPVVEPEYLDDIIEKSNEFDALSRSAVALVKQLSEINPFFTEEMRMAMLNAPGQGTIADIIAFALALPKPEAQEFLETLSVKARFEKLIVCLRQEKDVADIQKKISDDVNTKVTALQREFFLKEQLKVIKKELGIEEEGREKSSRTFRERIEAAGMPEETKRIVLDELNRFETLSENSPEYNVSRTYLETVCSLPWNVETQDNLDLDHAQQVLDQEHLGLDKVKERIIEFIAVRKLRSDPKGSILCLVGPPGVGKTSIGRSIAEALGRKFYRFSLGGMRDEAEIKGHRRTYVGALPGKILQAVRRAGSKNAVILLDEIDKLGQSFQGDPSSALLEVLDPEQNSSFSDHYLDLPFDLSKVLFIATANQTSTIPGPLLDRMETIELPGYTLEEKEDIAIRHVIPKELRANGIRPSQVKIDRQALRSLMQDYSREPGLRTLQQLINRIARRAATRIVRAEKSSRSKVVLPIRISGNDLVEWLGPKRFYNEVAERVTVPGVVTGLAWTASGGDILFIEAAELPGTGQLKLTGKMGDVMTESASIAWTYVKRKLAQENQWGQDQFKERDLHLHIPAGAIPKDGPSAGITMAAALYSLLRGYRSRQRVAMTGELSLTGKVLPVGGIKEKLLAAKRAGITTVILPKLNEKDLHEVPEHAKQDLNLFFVSSVEEVFSLVLEFPASKPVKVASRSAKSKKTRGKSKVTKGRTTARPARWLS